jgi:hypothetical protein
VIRWPWVSRALHDEMVRFVTGALDRAHEENVVEHEDWAKRYDELLARYHALRHAGFYAPDIRNPRPAEDVEKNAVRRAEAAGVRESEVEFKANAKGALMAEGVDALAAEREAERLYHETTDFDPRG